MLEIAVPILLALSCALIFAALRLMRRMLHALGRMELVLRAMSGQTDRSAGKGTRDDAEQERYARGVANILAYGTREMLRRGGEAQ